LELSSRFGAGANSIENGGDGKTLARGIQLVSIIKEVAPIKGAETDEALGVAEFQSTYFLDNPVYVNLDRAFFSALGNKSLLSQGLSTWNPFKLYRDFEAMKQRLAAKNVQGNLKGEGLIKGGLLVISPTDGVVYVHEEQSGTPMPYDEIESVVDSVVSKHRQLLQQQQSITATVAAAVAVADDVMKTSSSFASTNKVTEEGEGKGLNKVCDASTEGGPTTSGATTASASAGVSVDADVCNSNCHRAPEKSVSEGVVNVQQQSR
jgi:hypothetical protein